VLLNRAAIIFFSLFLPAIVFAQSPQFLLRSYPIRQVVPLPNGAVLAIGTYTAINNLGLYSTAPRHAHIALSSSDGSFDAVRLPLLGGSGNDIPAAVALDPSGNIWIAGNTDSDDFNLVNPIVARKVPYVAVGFLLELDPTATKLLFATYLSGQLPQGAPPYLGYSGRTRVTALTTDSAGNAYIGGDTSEADFPTTPGAYLSGQGSTSSFGDVVAYSYLAKISPVGKLIFSTQLATSRVNCSGGSGCIGRQSTRATIASIAVDSSGAALISGQAIDGYVSRIAPNGSAILWTTVIPSPPGFGSSISVTQDAVGGIAFFGRSSEVFVYPPALPFVKLPSLFAGKLNANGTVASLLDLGQSADAQATGIAQDAQGSVYLSGTSSSPQFPTLPGVPNLGPDFVLRLDTTGTKPQAFFRFPKGTITISPVILRSGDLVIPGSQNALLTLPAFYNFNTPLIVGFANAASYSPNAGAFPGAIISLFGFSLPPDAQVKVDGLPTTVLYSGPNQINLQIPNEVQSYPYPIQLQVIFPSGTISFTVPRLLSPGLFATDGIHAAALNQDGTVNSASNPAASGSIVSLFGTGFDTSASARSSLQASVGSYGFANLLYAGPAPGLHSGVWQFNVQLPQQSYGFVSIKANSSDGEAIFSNGVQVYVKGS